MFESSNTTFENTKLQTVFLSTERIVMANKKEYNKPCSHIHNVAGSSSQLGECFFFSPSNGKSSPANFAPFRIKIPALDAEMKNLAPSQTGSVLRRKMESKKDSLCDCLCVHASQGK